MEKIQIQFIVEDFNFQQTPFKGPGERVQDKETGIHYERKYLV